MSLTPQSTPAEQPTGTAVRSGKVTVQAVLAIEYEIETQVPVDDAEAVAVGRKRALHGPVRREIDLVTLSAARALKRHLLDSGRVTRLLIARGVADEDYELLVSSDAG